MLDDGPTPVRAPEDRGRAATLRRALECSLWVLPLLGVAIALATWEQLPLGVGSGLDPSAVNGVNLAANHGLSQGTELAWTYGPLGYLEQPSVAGEWTVPLGVAYTVLIRIALATSLLWAARRSFGLPAAAVLAYAVCAITGAEAAPISLALVWCFVCLDPDRPGWVRPLVTFGGGALAALEALVKINIGLEILFLVAIAVVAMAGPRRRNLAEFAGSLIATAAVLWLLAGQGVANVDDFLRSAFEIVSGYSAAMGTEAGAVEWDWVAAALMIAAVAGATVWTTRSLPHRARLGSLALVGALGLIVVKQGFVRHDVGHILALVAVLAAPLPALRWERGDRLVAAAAIVAFSLLAAPLSGRPENQVFRPLAAARDGVDQLRAGIDPQRRSELIEAQKAAARADYVIDPRTLAALRGGGVHVDPWEATAAWAYELDWDPLPVFQGYAAYTPELDHLNADALAAADGPDLILRHLTLNGTATASIDGRYAPFDAPATTRAMLCNFRATRTTDRYQVLARVPPRCGPETPVATVGARYDEAIEVPRARAGELVFARIAGLEPTGLGKLRTTLYKGVRRLIALDDRVYRLVGATAADGLLISAPPRADFPPPFALAPDPATITLGKDGGFGSGPDSFTVEFFTMAIER